MNKIYKEIAINIYGGGSKNPKAALANSFSHPHIVKMFDYFETHKEIYLVFEYLANGELYELIASNPLSDHQARKYFQQLISAIDYMHKWGVSHRDLKPENILLDNNNNIKIVDFGFSNLVKDGRWLKTSWGSPNYAAPEVIHGK